MADLVAKLARSINDLRCWWAGLPTDASRRPPAPPIHHVMARRLALIFSDGSMDVQSSSCMVDELRRLRGINGKDRCRMAVVSIEVVETIE